MGQPECSSSAGRKQFYFGDKTFLKKDSLVVPRIRMVDAKGDTYSYTEETIDDDAIRFFTYMQPYRATSPDGSKLAVASGRGAILETFSIESGIENIQTRYFIRPEDYLNGFEPDVAAKQRDVAEPHPWRRYFARGIDLALVGLPVSFVQYVLLHRNYTTVARWEDIVCALIGWGLLLLLEPLLLARAARPPAA